MATKADVEALQRAIDVLTRDRDSWKREAEFLRQGYYPLSWSSTDPDQTFVNKMIHVDTMRTVAVVSETLNNAPEFVEACREKLRELGVLEEMQAREAERRQLAAEKAASRKKSKKS